MADQQLPDQYNLVYTLAVQAGIKRDGTRFESREYTDGEWCRFQRGTPKKMGGYRQMFGTFNGIARGMVTNAFDGVNYVFAGNSGGIDVFTTGTTFGVGTGPFIANISGAFSADARNLWQFDLQYSPSGNELKVLAHPGLNLENIDNGVATQVLYGNINPSSPGVWDFVGLADTTGQNPTNDPIEVDGGVCVLYPYIFVYGSNGYIANNHVESTYGSQTLTDWNGPTANQVNMSSSKIVKGIPMRGGTNSPAGLFWATDSLIRVTFTGSAPLYWRYDIISSQISTMSSSCFVEMDGAYYWMGVDRFYVYNGQVSVLPNDKNVNWLFDNINYTQRQKVWATKVPRYNEIWFFYPRGDATECTDAIIYNVKDKIWYDAGEAVGAQRSCGWTTEIFPTPIWADWNYNVAYSEPFYVIATPVGQPDPLANEFYLDGNQTTLFAIGTYACFNNTTGMPVYQITNTQYSAGANCTLVSVASNIEPTPMTGTPVYIISGGYPIWQQEYGYNEISFFGETPVSSSFTTCDISWVGGTPAEDASSGANRRMHVRRLEPDFVQVGDMTLEIVGNKFARGDSQNSGPFTFGPDTGKIDMRVEHREMSLQFTSNSIDGNYEMGRILITAEYGDERP
jgi:hypothetical protein